MKVNLQLYSILREKLPAEDKGKTVLDLDDGSTIDDIIQQLGITRRVVIGVNGVQVTEKEHVLSDGDEIKIFSSISGG